LGEHFSCKKMKHAIQNSNKESITLNVLGSGLSTAPNAEEGIYVKTADKFWVIQGANTSETCYEGRGWHKVLLAKIEKNTERQMIIGGDLQACNIILNEKTSGEAGFINVKSLTVNSDTLQELEIDGCQLDSMLVNALNIKLLRLWRG
jgi:hypothetical protein